MKSMVEHYMIPLRSKEILSEEESMTVFASCTQIVGLSEQIITSLTQRLDAWNDDLITIGDVLLLYADFFKMYIPFANNFAGGRAILDGKNFDSLTQKASLNNVPTLDSLRIMPIQRIPRYRLLVSTHLSFSHNAC